jgi:hypothetical protein
MFLVGLLLLQTASASSEAAVRPSPNGPPPGQVADQRPLVMSIAVRDTPQYRFYRTFFPAGRPAERFDLPRSMSESDSRYASAAMQEMLTDLQDYARMEAPAIRRQLELQVVSVGPRLLLDRNVRIEFMNDGGTEAEAIAGSKVLLSPRIVKGFIAGGVEQIATARTGISSLLRGYLGWRPSPAGIRNGFTDQFGKFLDIAERTPPFTASIEEQMRFARAVSEAMNEERSTMPLASLDQIHADVTSGWRKPDVTESMAFSQFLVFSQTMVVEPALKFLLAHELGHVALGHTEHTDDGCQAQMRMEADADAFAVTLLSYEPMGLVEVLDFASEVRVRTPAEYVANAVTSEAAWLERFGFPQAFEFGMAEAGLRSDPACPGPSPAARTEAVTRALKGVMVAHLEAIAPLAIYAAAHPSVGAMRQTDRDLSPAEESVLLDEGRRTCPGDGEVLRREDGPTPMMAYRHQYTVRCRVSAPSLNLVSPDRRELAGWLYVQSLQGIYAAVGEAPGTTP